ncbi:hypothetical protein [Frankia sp. AgW1.1]|uniref:hypothetical protein n=1 Tax=Frankia sp. AgW1.1 TaxID=1836971 RepID=UPI0019323D85|nr:hypothetical protein [Frankia sp. AgW1.1]
MPEPQRCSFSAGIARNHVAHLWCWLTAEGGTWRPVGEQNADDPGVFSCDGKLTKLAAVVR